MQSAFIVKSGVERGVSRRGRIRRFGPSVGGLEVALRPAARQGCLQRVVVRVGIIGKNLIAAVAVQTRRRRSGDGIRERVRSDGVLVAVDVGDMHGSNGSVQRLNGIARVAQMNGVGSDVSDLQHPLSAESPLNRQVPLLRIWHLEVARHFEDEDARGTNAIAARLVSVDGRLRGIECRSARAVQNESLKDGCATDKTRTQLACRRKCVWVGHAELRRSAPWILRRRVAGHAGLEKIRQAAWQAWCSGDRNKGRLKAELIDCADVFAYIVNAIAGANRGGVFSEDVVRQADARAKALGVLIMEGASITGAGQTRDAEGVDTTGIDKGILALERQIRFEVADMAKAILPGAEELRAQPQV
jgi:hypothetical protein